jgi:hypothetical protein
MGNFVAHADLFFITQGSIYRTGFLSKNKLVLSAAEWVEKRREPLCRKAKKVPDTFDAPDTFN